MKHTKDIAEIVGIVADAMQQLLAVAERRDGSNDTLDDWATALKRLEGRRDKCSEKHVSIQDNRESLRRMLDGHQSDKARKRINRALHTSEGTLQKSWKSFRCAESALGKKKATVRKLRATCRAAKVDHREAIESASIALAVLSKLVEGLEEISH